MAGMAGRMSTVIKAKISKLLDRAEDPGETLDYSYTKQLESLQQVKKGIADVVTAKKRLGMQAQKLEQSVVKLDTQARQALAAGNEELARTALERKQLAQTELQCLDQQVAELQAQQEKLTESEKRLRAKIEAFRTKKEVIKAQYSAAEAQVRISEAATGVGEEMADVGLAMQRAVDKTENMKARASAVEELEAAGTFEDLTQLGSGQDDIDRELAELGTGGMVDDELAKMKAELGQGARRLAAELESGSGPAPAEGASRDRPRSWGRASTGCPRTSSSASTSSTTRCVAAVETDDEDAFHEAFEEMLDAHPQRGRAPRRRGDRDLRRHRPAGGHLVRRGGRRVHRRRPDPGLTPRRPVQARRLRSSWRVSHSETSYEPAVRAPTTRTAVSGAAANASRVLPGATSTTLPAGTSCSAPSIVKRAAPRTTT